MTRLTPPINDGWATYEQRETFSPEWDDFKAFREWALANGYSDELTIDRIDPDGDYGPTNCRWATWKEQRHNQRRCKGG